MQPNEGLEWEARVVQGRTRREGGRGSPQVLTSSRFSRSMFRPRAPEQDLIFRILREWKLRGFFARRAALFNFVASAFSQATSGRDPCGAPPGQKAALCGTVAAGGPGRGHKVHARPGLLSVLFPLPPPSPSTGAGGGGGEWGGGGARGVSVKGRQRSCGSRRERLGDPLRLLCSLEHLGLRRTRGALASQLWTAAVWPRVPELVKSYGSIKDSADLRVVFLPRS